MGYTNYGRHNAFLRSWYRSKHYENALTFAREQRAAQGCHCDGELSVPQHKGNCPRTSNQPKTDPTR